MAMASVTTVTPSLTMPTNPPIPIMMELVMPVTLMTITTLGLIWMKPRVAPTLLMPIQYPAIMTTTTVVTWSITMMTTMASPTTKMPSHLMRPSQPIPTTMAPAIIAIPMTIMILGQIPTNWPVAATLWMQARCLVIMITTMSATF